MEAVEETTFSLSEDAPQHPDRRRQPRHMTILRVGTLIKNDAARELCLIRNISAGGLKAHVYSALASGDTVAVELKSNQRIDGKVIWTDGRTAGIAFATRVDVEELLSAHVGLENGWRARLPRVEVDRLATLRLGADICGVSTRDISQGGVKLETDRPFAGGDEVVLTLDRFRPVHGTVRWYEDGLCGIGFNQLLPFHELMGWLRSN